MTGVIKINHLIFALRILYITCYLNKLEFKLYRLFIHFPTKEKKKKVNENNDKIICQIKFEYFVIIS